MSREAENEKLVQYDAVLLVVGMQNDKYRPASLRCSSETQHITACIHAPLLLARVNACIEAARERGWKVVFAMDLHHPQHVTFAKVSPHCVLQTWGSHMVNGLQYGFNGSDMVVRGLDKDDDSDDAFYVSKSQKAKTLSRLRHLLQTGNASRKMAVCGASPDGCIEATITTAATRGYCRGDPIVISDASTLLSQPSETPCLVLKTLSELLALWS